MKAFVTRVTRSEFLRNSAILASGTIIAQAIAILTAPFLTRIYLPEYYDVLGLYMMVTAIIGSLSTLQYHNVIITSADENEARTALSMCVVISACVAILMGIITAVLLPFIPQWLHSKSIKYWLLLGPISIFFGGWNIAFGAWANRKKEFKTLSVNRIFASILVPVVSISLGIIVESPMGLIVGLLVSQILPALLLSRYFFRQGAMRLVFSLKAFRLIARKYINFPKYSLASEFINNVISQLPVIMFATYYSVSGVIGNFNLSNRMLGMPIQLIAASMLEVFRQRASAEFHEKGNCHSSFRMTFKLLFLLSFLPFTILILAGPWIFSFVFGANWETAGHISRIMAPLFFLKFIVSPLSYVFFIAGKQKEDLYGHIAMIVLVVLSIIISGTFSENYFHALIAYSAAYCLIYIYYLIRSYQFSKG